MAFVGQFTCEHCNNECTEVVDCERPRMCARCRRIVDEAKKQAHLQALAQLPLETRIAKIEAYLFDLNAAQRISALEAHHIRY